MAVTYKGDILKLQGSKWDLPRDLPIEQACNWIEEQWIREEMERAATAIEEDMESEAALEADVPPPPAANAHIPTNHHFTQVASSCISGERISTLASQFGRIDNKQA